MVNDGEIQRIARRLYTTADYIPGIHHSLIESCKLMGTGVDGASIKVYSIAKTIADCFKYRNKIGLDTPREALKEILLNKRTSIKEILRFAEVRRVKEVIRPYLESIT